MTRRNTRRGRWTAARITLAVAAATMLAPAAPPSWSTPSTGLLGSAAEAQRMNPHRATRFLFWDICRDDPCAGGSMCCYIYSPIS